MTRICRLVVNPLRVRPIQQTPPCFLGGYLLVNEHRCRVKHLLFLAACLGGRDDSFHQPVQNASHLPAFEAIVDHRMGAMSHGRIGPWKRGPENEEDAVQNSPVIDTRNSARFVW